MQNQTTTGSPNEYLTVAQLAKRLQISASTIYSWVERNYIPYLMARDLLRFDPNVIKSWMSDQADRNREKKRQLQTRVVK
jgi:excisionase family DNA binding protein